MASESLTSKSNTLHLEQLAYSTNEILSSQDQKIIRQLLSEAQGSIDSIDAHIAHLETVRTLGIERMMKLRIGIAPQRHLPPEILAKIFIECANNEEVPIPRRRAPCIAWDLSQVCGRWRDIARTVPALWERVNVKFGDDYNLSLVAFDVLQDVLSHCGGQGVMKLTINPRTQSGWEKLQDLVTIYPLKLEELALYLDNTCLQPLSVPIEAFDNLQSVPLSFLDSLDTRNTPILAFCRSRNLRAAALHLNDYQHPPMCQQSMVPWAALTDLTLTCIAPNSVLFILSHCSLLTKLAVGLTSDDDDHTYAMELPVSLHHLQSIAVHFDFEGVLDDLLSELVLPSLLEFDYTGDEESPGFDPSELLALIERSACLISILRIRDFNFDFEDTIPVMRALPTLTKLTLLVPCSMPDSILSTFKTENLMQNLQEFSGGEFSSVHSGIDFLNSRWSQTTPGKYNGLRHLKFWLTKENYTFDDQRYFETLLPEWEKHGRQVELLML